MDDTAEAKKLVQEIMAILGGVPKTPAEDVLTRLIIDSSIDPLSDYARIYGDALRDALRAVRSVRGK